MAREPMTPAPDEHAEAPPLERRLAAILAADVEGYSRLMHADEDRTLATLASHRDIIDNLILTAHGQIFATAGDSVLAEFPSVVEAFQCAVAIQQALTKANAALPNNERMYLRIGINSGDVVVRNGDILGDGVNIAARVEALAEPGGICVTRVVRDQLRDRVDTHFEDLGEHSVKNIARPVRVFRAVFDPTAEPSLPERPRATEEQKAEEKAESAPPAESDSAEIVFWQSVEASNDDGEYQIYLERYPEGAFAELARTRLASRAAEREGGPVKTGVELAFWETVRDSRNPDMIKAYLDKYPEGEFKKLAEILLTELDAEAS
jgi:adenylate cyclase